MLNTSLVSKEIVSGTYHWNYMALIFLSSCVYAAAPRFGWRSAFSSAKTYSSVFESIDCPSLPNAIASANLPGSICLP